MSTSTTLSMLPASFGVPSTLKTGMGDDRRRVGSLVRWTNSSSTKSPVAPQSTMASEFTSCMVSVVLRWTGIKIHLGPSSREFITSLWCIRFSHLGRRGRGVDIAGGGEVLVGCASSSLFTYRDGSESSSIASTEKRLLLCNRGAPLTRCLTQNPPCGWASHPLPPLVTLSGRRPLQPACPPRRTGVHRCPCGGRQTVGHSPLPNGRGVRSGDRCQGVTWPYVSHLCPSEPPC